MEVKLFANLRNICNGVSVEVMPDGNRVIDILDKMVEMFPEMDEEIFIQKNTLKPFFHIYVNGKNIIHCDHLQTKVKETDQIALFPPAVGS